MALNLENGHVLGSTRILGKYLPLIAHIWAKLDKIRYLGII
jgi:hypothetical protein